MSRNRKSLAALAIALVALGAPAVSGTAHAEGFGAHLLKQITPPAVHPAIDGIDKTNGNLGRPLSGGY